MGKAQIEEFLTFPITRIWDYFYSICVRKEVSKC